ncbi:MAG: hypothetical protein H0W78_07470 [Planctomycetes bacterium]|nr:hypothetical protein [Planctomycetota bacterium]
MALNRKLKRWGKRLARALNRNRHILLPEWRTVTDLPHGPGIAMTVEEQEVWFSSPDADLHPTPEAAVCLLAPWCVHHNLNLRLVGKLPAPAFLANVHSATTLMGSWWGHRPVTYQTDGPLDLPSPASPPTLEGDTGLFFSGGVDSFYSLVQNPDIRVILFVVGFDIPLANRAAWEARIRCYREVAHARGITLVTVFTNLRERFLNGMSWSQHHGCALTAVAHSLGTLASRWLISASFFPGFIMPWGTHPDLDWRWGSDSTSFQHFGIDRWRGEKLAAMADEDFVHRNLHVCYANPDGSGDCGKCEKCVRTRLTYHCEIPGRRCSQMPDSPPLLQAIDGIDRLPNHALVLVWEHFCQFLPAGDPLSVAVEQLLKRSRAGLR